MKFMPIVWATFLARVRPVSTRAKPACMNMTRKPATRVQTRLTAVWVSVICRTRSVVAGSVIDRANVTELVFHRYFAGAKSRRRRGAHLAAFTRAIHAGNTCVLPCRSMENINPGHTAWMLIATALVMLMVPGLALFYGGMVQGKNVLST